MTVTGTGMFVAFRDALTLPQREALAHDLLADAARKGMPVVSWPVPLPALSREQAAAFEALECRLARSLAASPGGPLEYAALASFFKTGDVRVLESNMVAARFPLEELVSFAGLLDASQRREIFAAGVPGLPGAMREIA
jgi:hypothetical protein